MNRFSMFFCSIIFCFLTACGSGGGSESPPAETPKTDTPADPPATDTPTDPPTTDTPTAEITTLIVIDQFGYLPNATKVAVLRDPQIGYDSDESYQPSQEISLVDSNDDVVFTATATQWNNGNTDASSGDKVWWFDFSSVTTPGSYTVVDVEQGLKSATFSINENIYKEVLKHAFRTFLYQRAGYEKQPPYIPLEWADTASHIGPGQDIQARLYSTPNNASSERDLSGGWYDAGDYNKYTSWTANYVVSLLHAYIENPAAWGDDFNIPESENGVADLLDEVKWGLDFLKKMQDGATDGGVLSIVGLDHASPPSAATGASYYGPASTSATLATASAFALASTVYDDLPDSAMIDFANDLKVRAEQAWQWADANPAIIFNNNDSANGSSGLGAGNQEDNDDGRAMKKRMSAIYLFAATSNDTYKNHIDANYQQSPLFAWNNYADPFREQENNAFLYYATLPNATTEVANAMVNSYKAALDSADNLGAIDTSADPYRAHLPEGHYTWGSNNIKGLKASLFLNLSTYGIGDVNSDDIDTIALDYLHYLHGVNPQATVYLSNMYELGVHNSVNEFYHTWFGDGSDLWDRVGESTYGPAPGFLVGGPNPSYDWDSSCDGSSASDKCGSEAPSPPKGQPTQKSYLDFNTSWPINSWSVTENSCGYQVSYLRVLSKFVTN